MGAIRNYADAGADDAMRARSHLLTAQSSLENAADHIAAQEWNEAHNDLDYVAQQLGECAYDAFWVGAFGDSLTMFWRNAFYWIEDNWPTAAEVTMDAILNAMLGAEFDDLQKFIGIVDAYRVAIWNAPFNAEFYASLARGFIKWPQY